MRRMVNGVIAKGWQAVVFNPRGAGGAALVNPQSYSSGYTHDLRQIIQHIHKKYPKRPLFGIGYSLGKTHIKNT